MVKISSFKGEKDGIKLTCKKIHLSISNLQEKQLTSNTLYSSVSHNMVSHIFPSKQDLIGDILLIVRTQGGDQQCSIFWDGSVSIKYALNTTSAMAFTIFLRYLFDWINNYVAQQNITDSTGQLFVIPPFEYSPSDFNNDFI